MDTLKSGLSSSTDTLNIQEFVSKYTANFYSVNFSTMKMKIDTESKSESKLQFDCHHVSNGLLLPWRAQYKKSKPEDRSCRQPGQYHPGRQVDGDYDHGDHDHGDHEHGDHDHDVDDHGDDDDDNTDKNMWAML